MLQSVELRYRQKVDHFVGNLVTARERRGDSEPDRVARIDRLSGERTAVDGHDRFRRRRLSNRERRVCDGAFRVRHEGAAERVDGAREHVLEVEGVSAVDRIEALIGLENRVGVLNRGDRPRGNVTEIRFHGRSEVGHAR